MAKDMNQNHFAYKPIGALREKLEARLAIQKQERILGEKGVLSDVNNFNYHGVTVAQLASEIKWHISRKIQKEIDLIEGFKHVFRAIFSRER